MKKNASHDDLSQLSRAVTGAHASIRRPVTTRAGFDIRPTHFVFVVNTVALRHDFILLRRVSPVSIRPSIFHTHHGHYIIIAFDYVNNPST